MVMGSGDKSPACPLSYKADAADPGHDYPPSGCHTTQCQDQPPPALAGW